MFTIEGAMPYYIRIAGIYQVCPLAIKPHLQSIEATIGGNTYQHTRVNQWTSSVVELCLGQLSKLGKPFKYIGMYSPLLQASNDKL